MLDQHAERWLRTQPGFSTPLASYVWPDGVTRYYPGDAA